MRETGNRNYFSQTDPSSAYPAWKEKQNTSCPGLLFCGCRKAHSEKQAFIWRLFCAVFRRKGGEKSVEETTSEWEKRGRQRDKTRRSRKGHLKEGSKQKRVSLTCGMGFNKIYFTKKSTQTYCQLEGTWKKKESFCDMFETVCWIPKPRVTPMWFFSYRLLSFLLVLFQRLLRQKKDLTYPALPYFAWNFLRTPRGERGKRILNGPPFAASSVWNSRKQKKAGKGRTYFQNWSVAWPPSPSEDMAKKNAHCF